VSDTHGVCIYDLYRRFRSSGPEEFGRDLMNVSRAVLSIKLRVKKKKHSPRMSNVFGIIRFIRVRVSDYSITATCTRQAKAEV